MRWTKSWCMVSAKFTSDDCLLVFVSLVFEEGRSSATFVDICVEATKPSCNTNWNKIIRCPFIVIPLVCY